MKTFIAFCAAGIALISTGALAVNGMGTGKLNSSATTLTTPYAINTIKSLKGLTVLHRGVSYRVVSAKCLTFGTQKGLIRVRFENLSRGGETLPAKALLFRSIKFPGGKFVCAKLPQGGGLGY